MYTSRRLLAVLSLLAVLLATLLTGLRPVSITHAQTPGPQSHVCGVLGTTTTWTTSGSPYELDCSVTVPVGAVLTIQPGVLVYATANSELSVAGTLRAAGVAGSPTTFTCASTSCAAGFWYGIIFQHGASPASSLSYSSISGAAIAIEDYPTGSLTNANFDNDTRDLLYTAPHTLSLQNSAFHNFFHAIEGAGASLALTSDTFGTAGGGTAAVLQQNGNLSATGVTIQGASTGLATYGGQLTVSNSTLQGVRGVSTEISAGPGTTLSVQNSTIQNAAQGINAGQTTGHVQITGSTVQNTDLGIILDVQPNSVQINNNTLIGNTTNIYVLTGTTGATADATNNYFGTTDVSVIAASIYDCHSNPALPCVTFQPFLPGAPGAPTPTASPTYAQITVSPNPVLAGSVAELVITGAGFTPGELVVVDLTVPIPGGESDSQQTTTRAFGNGTFIVQLPAPPATAEPGAYVIFASGTSSRRTATTTITVTTAATATPSPTATATATPSPTPTLTPTVTATPTSTPTAAPTATPTRPPTKPYKLLFRQAYLWYHTVRAGTYDRVVIRSNHYARLIVALRVIFPTGGTLHIAGRTNHGGKWERYFIVPRTAYSRSSPTALAVVQLRHGLTTKQVVLQFKVIRPR